MAGGKKAKAKRPVAVQGWKLLAPVHRLLERLHAEGTQRDRAGNRQLFYDQFAALLLLYFFTPALTSLRGLAQATALEKLQRRLGLRKTSLASLHEAGQLFDAARLREIVQELAAEAAPLTRGAEAHALRELVAVDGSFFTALPRMAWALWKPGKKGVKLHLHFAVEKGVPCDATLTHAHASEARELGENLRPGCVYVMDRGYNRFSLFTQILAAGGSFITRLKENIAHEVRAERPIPADAKAAGVTRDVILTRLGSAQRPAALDRPLRLVRVQTVDRQGQAVELALLTDLLEPPAEVIAWGYRQRWSVELFFKWMKHVINARHLLLQSENGVALQMYAALICSLLLVLYTGRKPTKRTYEMLQFYLLGIASEAELLAHLEKLARLDAERPAER